MAAGSHDWFEKDGGSGIGLIDVTDAASLKTQLANGANIAFIKKMQFTLYSVQDGVLLMDAVYSRDYMNKDKTAFAGNGTKNTTSPLDWGTSPGGSNVSDKTDILDTYVSMRRDGISITGNSPGNLIATIAPTTLATAGDHYADFEFYKQRIAYNQATGKFENSGSSTAGGHSVWEFNADGSIRRLSSFTAHKRRSGSDSWFDYSPATTRQVIKEGCEIVTKWLVIFGLPKDEDVVFKAADWG